MSIRHIVLFRFKPSVTADQKDRLAESILALGHQVDTVRSMSVGADLGAYPGNYEFAVVVDFDDEAGLKVYNTHPDHLRMAQPTLDLVDDIAVLDYALPEAASPSG